MLAGVLAGIAYHRKSPDTSRGNLLQVVAAENFWGSLASQLGGSHVKVTSVVSDPNADPHEYESNTATAREFAGAKYVILNGAGYDSWANKLLSANSNKGRKVLSVPTYLANKTATTRTFGTIRRMSIK